MPALPHHSPLSVYTIPIIFKNNLPSIKNIIIFKSKNTEQNIMNALLIMGWATLATWVIPNTIKDEELRYGMRLVLGSMSIGVLIGALVF
jgi:hypothetical protein